MNKGAEYKPIIILPNHFVTKRSRPPVAVGSVAATLGQLLNRHARIDEATVDYTQMGCRLVAVVVVGRMDVASTNGSY